MLVTRKGTLKILCCWPIAGDCGDIVCCLLELDEFFYTSVGGKEPVAVWYTVVLEKVSNLLPYLDNNSNFVLLSV